MKNEANSVSESIEMRQIVNKTLLVAAIGLLAGACAVIAEEDWMQWRGPNRDGVIAGKAWPATLEKSSLSLSWRVDLGEGYPGPIVAGDRVFTVESVGKKSEAVRAFDRETGKELWKHSWDGGMKVPFFAAKNGSWVRSTPATDGKTLVVGGMQEILVGLDVATGEVKWRFDVAKKLKSDRPSFGFVCSPLIEGEFVFLQVGGGVAKLELSTGKVVWHTGAGGDGMSDGAFSSPMLATVHGKHQLVVQGRNALQGMDPSNGETAWSQPVKAFRGMNIVTPIPFNDGFFTTAYGGRSKFWAIENEGDSFQVNNTWDNKLQGYMSTPVVVGSHAYMHLRNQRAACVDLESGEIAWVTDDRFGKYWSLVAQGDRLLALDERGELILFEANPEQFQIIARREIADAETWGHLTVVDGQVFIRELKGLAAWDWKGTPSLALNR